MTIEIETTNTLRFITVTKDDMQAKEVFAYKGEGGDWINRIDRAANGIMMKLPSINAYGTDFDRIVGVMKFISWW